ncbi:MAG: sulfatase [Verrucomicrobiota bacterium]|nr:sulfatase [Verrucomicrobiota bacterium]
MTINSLLFLFCCLSLSSNFVFANRPNILFAFADDWGRQASIYAEIEGSGGLNDLAKTPNFDKLAKRGVLFTNASVNAPSCTPCRSAILSGRNFWETGRGAILQGAVWDEKIPTWPLLLQNSGYHLGFTYKVWSPGAPRDAGIGGQANAFSKAGGKFNGFSQYVSARTAKGIRISVAKEELYREARGNFKSFLEARMAGQPFAYWFGPTNVHRKWTKGSGLKLWGIDPDDLKGKMPGFLPDVHAVRQDLADYLGEIAAFDAGLGLLIEELKKAGEYENTIIVVSGDHGPPGFPHGKCNLYDFGTRVCLAIAGPGVTGGRVVDDFVCLPDLAPTFLEAGKVAVPEVMSAKSLWKVLRSQKKGQVDPSRDAVITGRERHVYSSRPGYLPYPQRAIRTKDFQFVINFKPDRWPLGDPYLLNTPKEPDFSLLENQTFVTLADEDAGPTKAWIVTNRKDPKVKPFFEHAYGKRPREELYDVNRDPDQMKNLAQDPAYAKTVRKLRSRLMNYLSDHNDPRLEDGGKFFETSPMTDAFQRPARPPKKTSPKK